MESNSRSIYCKYCGQLCVKRISRSKDNPGRIFWACPMEWGGHGWMKWVDYSPSTYSKRVAQLERTLDEAGNRVKELSEENKNLKKELKNNIMVTRCLKKFLKGTCLTLCLALGIIVFSVSNGELSNVALGP